jgi:hypothetical protein
LILIKYFKGFLKTESKINLNPHRYRVFCYDFYFQFDVNASFSGGLKMVTVKVIYQSSGKPAEGKKVALYVNRFMASGVTDGQYTDSNGEVHFDIESTDGEVYVDGSTKHKGRLVGRVVIYL